MCQIIAPANYEVRDIYIFYGRSDFLRIYKRQNSFNNICESYKKTKS